MVTNLVLMRHGETPFTLKNKFAGRRDIGLSEAGSAQCLDVAAAMRAKGLAFDLAFTSMLRRTRQSCAIVLDAMSLTIPVTPLPALDERDYGALTGMNRDDARRLWGTSQVESWRRSFDNSPPNGESLKDLAVRTWPCLYHDILPAILKGNRVLIVAHGNVLRTLIVMLERRPADGLDRISVPTGSVFEYRVDADLRTIPIC